MLFNSYIPVNSHRSPGCLLPSVRGVPVSINQPAWAPTSAPTSQIAPHIPPPTFDPLIMVPYPQEGGKPPNPTAPVITNDVMYALEIARESPEGAQSPLVMTILNTALDEIWMKILLHRNYIMTRDEFAVFNYFQHRFVDNKLAVAARKRYWDNASGDPCQNCH
ncbi:hypothetical protein F4779DRAFT_40404 [Xylariaceae sp. FL0662B]|nr:hypothetical protein F4779DRAFT_40404 [Xylariaceae sp. FL0662B]